MPGGTKKGERRGDYKEYKKAQFIDAFRNLGTIHHAAKAVNISRDVVADWRKKDPKFDAAFQEADEDITDALRRSALQKALVGVERPIYQGGKKVGSYREHSDRLHALLLQARDPKFRPHIRHELDDGFVRFMVAQLRGVLQRHIPDICPHCQNNLNLTKPIREQLEALSTRFKEVSNQ